jgi:small-conductance mechanosensitive channel
MTLKQNGPILLITALLIAVGIGVYRTGLQVAPPTASAIRRAPADRAIVVDQSSLATAEQLVRLPTTPDERPFAEDALRLADQEMDLAFAQAVRMAANRAPTLSPEAKQIDAQLQQALKALAADQAQVASLTNALASAKPADVQPLTDRLNLAKAQAALDQDEVDDARADLRRAGGDLQGRMQAMVAEHDAASRGSDSVRVNVTAAAATHGLINHLRALQSLYAKESAVRAAGGSADSLANVFKARHDRLEARAAARLRDSASARLTHDSSAALLAATQRRALDEKSRATLDQRVDDQHRLADIYAGWANVIVLQERTVINRALRSIAAILVIALIAILVARWIEHVIGGATMDRRRAQTAYMVSRVSLQVVAVLLILLVIFGPPNNLGTFLGLAGAGLTVALKDFIVGFFGWFVLMGKNGIRIGDLVEINGVTGEVVELGIFYTVLLETGSWSESGHPTGRRVTFTNGFAIEGHFFNFSTSGRWLWDEVRIVVPAGRDPYPIVEAIRAQLDEATADSARQAETEWRVARRSPQIATVSAEPSIHLKPIAGGIEIYARYITHVSEREQLRARLYHTAVDLLGGVTAPVVTPALATRAAGS